MKYFLCAIIFVFLAVKSSALQIIIDTNDYQIRAEATVSVNITQPVIVSKDGQEITLDQEKYNNLITALDSLWKKPEIVPTSGGVIINISFHPFAIEALHSSLGGGYENTLERKALIIEYYKGVFDGTIDPYDDSKLPPIEPIPMGFWVDFWEGKVTGNYDPSIHIYE